ncbi:glucan biosynthesis protein [Salinarimonas ramus]|uniref:Glucan biosynthesis protein D n=1 Tax=Salinarimonas ramus TaxID=690164 RepID=A0A917Q4X8_9HYPH|nr:glucan biosynthesis protein [Salinarimonas ramus]GGK21388.1 glucan biosynthesis protein D [Salinarimonas ramus]
MADQLSSTSPTPARRSFLRGLAGLAGLAALPRAAWAQAGLVPLGPPRAYDFDRLARMARELAGRAYVPPPTPAAETVAGVDYDDYQRIRFREEAALFAGQADAHPIGLFHLHKFAPSPVTLSVVTDAGAQAVLYSPNAFSFAPGRFTAESFPADLGYAGFRVKHADGRPGDWLAFMGASYFRSSDPFDQYGLSARGLAIDTTVAGRAEEFPRFTSFWIDQRPAGVLVIDALLDSPSVAGAYRIEIRRGAATTMDVTTRLFFREGVRQLGVAPLTSMFWYSETNRHAATDWRPEIHDSDGLALWTGAGERLIRPLNNPPVVVTSSFVDENPRGFGLVKRDRAFANFEDDGVFYEKRPSVWVEPLGEWGRGAVQLVEIPTDDEIHDNIVAFWNPERLPAAGDERAFAYRLHWAADEPREATLGRAVATRLGRPGAPGSVRPPRGNKIVVDFAGGRLAELGSGDGVEPIVAAGAGTVSGVYALRVRGHDHWRLVFDIDVPDTDASDPYRPVELRAYLAHGGEPLTETWAFQHRPVRF